MFFIIYEFLEGRGRVSVIFLISSVRRIDKFIFRRSRSERVECLVYWFSMVVGFLGVILGRFFYVVM